jgi:protein AATF/BFR2
LDPIVTRGELISQVESEKPFMESEETGYRLLLKEVIESRSGGAGGADLTHLRREKKKKREAERGGSKGRKLR